MSPVSPVYRTSSGLTSRGAPYFSLATTSDLTTFQGFTGTNFTLWATVRIHAFPQQHHSQDENHSIFSAWTAPPNPYDIFKIGITPLGGLTVDVVDFSTPTGIVRVRTAIGAVSPATGVFTIYVSMVNSNVTMTLIPGHLSDSFVMGGVPLGPQPESRQISLIRRSPDSDPATTMRLGVFSSLDGISRFRGVIYECGLLSTKHPIAWFFNEGTGSTVRMFEQANSSWYAHETEFPSSETTSYPYNFDLTAQYLADVQTAPWGENPPAGQPLSSAYSWGPGGTSYSRVSPVSTSFTSTAVQQPTYLPGGGEIQT